jgi:hypothetical protein
MRFGPQASYSCCEGFEMKSIMWRRLVKGVATTNLQSCLKFFSGNVQILQNEIRLAVTKLTS